MTTQQSSSIVREAAQAFRQVTTSDAVAVDELLALFEAQPIPAADAVLLLANLEIDRRRLMRRVLACTSRLRGTLHECGEVEP